MKKKKDIVLDECPFCGSIPHFITEHDFFGREVFKIRCFGCGILTDWLFTSKEEAAKFWNDRNRGSK